MGRRHGRRVRLPLLAVLLAVLLALLVGLAPARAQASNFTDVADDAWYAEAVNWVSRNGTMNGYSDGSFGPEDALLREQAAAVLRNYLAPTATAKACALRDVERGFWYTESVDWAVETGTMTGYADGTFGVGDTLTREQLAAIMARVCGADLTSVDTSKFNALSDHASTSDWARESVAWAVQHGVINGIPGANGTRTLVPQGTVTRAQMAAIMMNAANEGLLGGGAAIGSLKTDIRYFYVNNTDTVTFTLITSKTINSVVNLFDEFGNKVTQMQRSGGIYKCSVRIDGLAIGCHTYYAEALEGESSEASIFLFDKPNDRSYKHNEVLRKRLKSAGDAFKDSSGYIPSDKVGESVSAVAQCARSLVQEGEAVEWSQSGNSVYVKLVTGVAVVWDPRLEGVDGGGSDVSMTIETCEPYFTSRYDELGMLTLDGRTIAKSDLVDQAAKNIERQFRNYLFFTSNDKHDDDVTLDTVRNFKSNQVVIWQGHGTWTNETGSILWTAQPFDGTLFSGYFDDMVLNRVAEGADDGVVGAATGYFEKYCGDLSNSLFYLGACKSGDDESLPKALLDHGAVAVVADIGTIYSYYDLVMQYNTISLMTTVNPMTGNYFTLGEAIQSSKNKFGSSDILFMEKFGWDERWDIVTGREPAAPFVFGGDQANNYRFNDISSISVRLSEAYVTLYDDGELVLSADDSTDSGRTFRYHGTWFGFNTYEGENSDWSQLRKVTSRCRIWANDNDNLVFLAMHPDLTDISGLSSWDVSKVTDMTNVFVGCSSLTDSSPISSWDTSSVRTMYEMFAGCSSLSDLTPIEGWNVSSVIDGGMNSMFGGTAARGYPSWYKG